MLHTTFHLQPSQQASATNFLSAKNTLQPRGFLQQHRTTPSPVVLHFLQGTSQKEKHLKISSASVPCAALHLQRPHKQLIFTILLLASAVHSDCAASPLVRRSLHHIVVVSVLTIFFLSVLRFSLTPTRRSAVAPLPIGTTADPACSSPPRFVSWTDIGPYKLLCRDCFSSVWLRSWHHCLQFGTVLRRAPPALAANVEMPQTNTDLTFKHSLRLQTKH